MRYRVLACDYDGTIATHGTVDAATIAALEALKASGRKLVLVTGRHLGDLFKVLPHIELFDRVVAENGGLLYCPESQKEKALGEQPPAQFVEALRARGVTPVDVGRVVVATWHPHETVVLETIRDLGLEHQVIFNKGAVMVLPPGVNKATGLEAALVDLGMSRHEVIGVGDAENDHAFLTLSECAVAVANALPIIKERVDLVTTGDHGAGVAALIEQVLSDDLASAEPRLLRHHVSLGKRADGTDLLVPPYGRNILVAGPSGSGKSTFATGLLERLLDRHYQACVIDPEGDYETFDKLVSLGDPQRAPGTTELEQLLAEPANGVSVNLLGLQLSDRPAFFDQQLLPRIQGMRAKSGRPHWLLVDEAHHLMPKEWALAEQQPQRLHNSILVTVHPSSVSRAMLQQIHIVVAVGANAEATLREYAEACGHPVPAGQLAGGGQREALVWDVAAGTAPEAVAILPPEAELRRHRRKYAEGDLDDKAFYFRGPDDKLNLRAQNLALFVQIAEGVDDETWTFHLKQGDVSRWFREAIKNEELAVEAAAIEAATTPAPSAAESRARIREAIEKRYTLAAA